LPNLSILDTPKKTGRHQGKKNIIENIIFEPP
jgi:hypothetical protein